MYGQRLPIWAGAQQWHSAACGLVAPRAHQLPHYRSVLRICSPHPAPQGKDWNGQLKYGTSNFYGANYFQSVTPQLSLGGEVFYLAEQRRRWAQPSATAGHWCRWCRCCCSWSALCCSVGAGLKPAPVAPGLPCAACTPARAGTPALPAACVVTEATGLPAPTLCCSGIGLAARHAGEKHIATAQVANTGLVSLTYIQKISEKVWRP